MKDINICKIISYMCIVLMTVLLIAICVTIFELIGMGNVVDAISNSIVQIINTLTENIIVIIGLIFAYLAKSPIFK